MINADFLPSANLNTLRFRAVAMARIRRFFDEQGYFEVDTPILSRDRCVDPNIAVFETRFGQTPAAAERPRASGTADDGTNATVAAEDRFFLQTSPEFAMKRLLTAGATAIYQLGHVFRNGEAGTRHNPEFSMLEWYRCGDTHLEQMQVTEQLIAAVAGSAATAGVLSGSLDRYLQPFKRTTYRAAFLRCGQPDPFTASISELAAACRTLGAEIAAEPAVTDLFAADSSGADLPAASAAAAVSRDDLLNIILALAVEPQLGEQVPEFLLDYPASQAAIARLRPADPVTGSPAVAERFELYIRGVELCNGYHELTDPAEFQERIAAESMRRAGDGLPALPADNRLLAAMHAGLPASCGVALGVDRVLMVLLGLDEIADVIPFAWDRT